MGKDEKNLETSKRRTFLMGSSAMLLSSLNVFAKEKAPILDIPQWSSVLGAACGEHQYGMPVPYEKLVTREYSNAKTAGVNYNAPMEASNWTLTPLEKLHGSITPNGLFFTRAHGGFPDIDPKEHRLVIHGLVKNDLLLDMSDIKRFPSETKTHFLECSGNSDLMFENLGSSCTDIHGLVSAAQWTGVKLSVLLKEAGIDLSKAKYILAEGADSVKMTRTIPISRAMDDCLVVYAQNGEALRKEQGYPIRLLVPGCEGNINVKWLRRLKVSQTPFYAKDETSRYTDLNSNTEKATISTLVMETKSIITFPSGGQALNDKGYYQIRGIAWSGRGKITRVDVSTDGGKNWKEATLKGPVLTQNFTEFTLDWKWDGKETVVMSRSQDETGSVQPYFEKMIAARTLASSYHINAIQAWKISTDGKVSNVKNTL